ncbi:hypothetical protein PtB15_5B378 [Puccinia triticina]|nr:hypothetical protein PtB15_5B378 [Puccinia triticina]
MEDVRSREDLGSDPDEAVIPAELDHFMHHPTLEGQSARYKISSVATILHMAYSETCTLQVEWNDQLLEAFQKTTAHFNDSNLLALWNQQLSRIRYAIDCGFLTEIPGDLHEVLVMMMNGQQVITEGQLPHNEDADEEDESEQQYLEDIENILAKTMLADLEQEATAVNQSNILNEANFEYQADVF